MNSVGLTARETEILERVVQGLTDREIARDLVISPKTVDRHLRNIFRKLGVSSRTAYARCKKDGCNPSFIVFQWPTTIF
ncbi:MAG: hypothetical protein C7B47_12095 [Sulfobacillus thermosulfidooxidans]|uniref:HTH luxR-type domain-containing protein n=1 Tax=Sulfobacillus thermosulfidooxidans TaxID=28034 RepID=A0A2T2WTD0_SULTH|nr:MAG: hypothetical protein C7B47_12095 [Sulfobacillus thermosulfidooxidans]